jgi:hypothetical protein
MALQLGALREALIEAGASSEKANQAAEEVASYENRLASIEGRLQVLTWMVGTNIVVTLGVLWRLLSIKGL